MRYKAFLMLVAALLLFLISCDNSSNDEGNRSGEDVTVNFYDGEHLYCLSTAKAGELVSEPTQPQREYYDFVGWYDGTVKWDFSTDRAEKDLTLMAKWCADFEAMLQFYSGAGIELDADGAYLKIETRLVEVNENYSEVNLAKIKDVNTRLGLPDGLYQQMLSTASTDGAQSVSNEYATVEWESSPQSGLRVIYIRK